MEDNEIDLLSKKILAIVFNRRKLLKSEEVLNKGHSEEAESKEHLVKIKLMIRKKSPIKMVLPAYPAKSPNRNKTLSKNPDLAEEHSIDVLHSLCRDIDEVYPNGSKILICSDGYVFSDLVRVTDQDVFDYTKAIENYSLSHYPKHFEFYDIKDAYPELKSLDAMREELIIQYGESLIGLTKKAKSNKETHSMHHGITRFLYEDFLELSEFNCLSNSKVKKEAKDIALRVILRSNAWGELIKDKFPDALRLSIHPQFRVSSKIGIHLDDSNNSWRTPWHSVEIKDNGKIILTNRNTINENDFRLIFKNGSPYHYSAKSTECRAEHV